jgi:hypothetical protein
MWTQTKQNYDKHVEQMENWKDIAMKEDYVSKVKPCSFVSNGVGSTNVQCNVGISKHILD